MQYLIYWGVVYRVSDFPEDVIVLTYFTRTNFINRPETFQSWTYKLPSLSQ